MRERYIPESSPAETGELLAQVVTCLYKPNGDVTEYIGSGPYATSPDERHAIENSYSAPLARRYSERVPGEYLIGLPRSFNYGGLILDNTGSMVLMIRKNHRPGWDIPAGCSRQIDPYPAKTFDREVFAEEAVLVSNGRLVLPERHGPETLAELKKSWQTFKTAKDESIALVTPIDQDPIFIKDGCPDILKPLLNTFTVVHRSGRKISVSDVLISIHSQGGDIIFPLQLPFTPSEVVPYDLECLRFDEGLKPLQRQHAWFPLAGLNEFSEGKSLQALVYEPWGLTEETVDPVKTPFFPLAKAVSKKLVFT